MGPSGNIIICKGFQPSYIDTDMHMRILVNVRNKIFVANLIQNCTYVMEAIYLGCINEKKTNSDLVIPDAKR